MNDFGFNTVVSSLMEYSNKHGDKMTKADKEAVTQLMAPIFPHVAEEIWHQLGHEISVFHSTWPTYDPAALAGEDKNIVFQVNGKTKGIVTVSATATQQDVEAAIKADERLAAHYPESVKKVVFISGRLINFVLE
jgi:leucyl-tRNA synthetase